MKNKLILTNVMGRLSRSAAFGLLAIGVFGGSQALAQMSSTRHNLGSGQTITGANETSGTAEICVFCHTPHGANTAAVVPLWNRTLPAASAYITYNNLGTSTMDGATVPVGSVSIACLSCHDGVQAMNSMINLPGSGGYNSLGSLLAGTWTGGQQTTGQLTNANGFIANLGTDLRNDHPIGVQYAGGLTGNASLGLADMAQGAGRDADFRAATYVNLNGNPVWYVETAVAGTRSKADLTLYTRVGGTALFGTTNSTAGGATLSGNQAYVECASCHDPHTQNATFLRISNAGSAVCLACHIK